VSRRPHHWYGGENESDGGQQGVGGAGPDGVIATYGRFPKFVSSRFSRLIGSIGRGPRDNAFALRRRIYSVAELSAEGISILST